MPDSALSLHALAVRSYFFHELVATHYAAKHAYPAWPELRSYFAKANACAATYAWPQMPRRGYVVACSI